MPISNKAMGELAKEQNVNLSRSLTGGSSGSAQASRTAAISFGVCHRYLLGVLDGFRWLGNRDR